MNVLPERLLPKKRYKLINLDDFQGKYYLIRRSICSNHSDHKDLKKIDPKCFIKITEHWGKGISCNLFGIFLVKDLSISANEEFWYPCFNIKESKDIITKDLENSLPIFIEIKEIHNQSFPYKHPEKVEKEIPNFKKMRIENAEEVNKLLANEFKGSCKVIHKPTLANYWHFEIYFYDEGGEQISNKTIALKKLVFSFIHSFIFNASQYSKPKNCDMISRKLYDPLIPCYIQRIISYIKIFLGKLGFKKLRKNQT